MTKIAPVLGITGATGAVGETLVRQLAEKPDIRVLALVRRQPRFAGSNIQTVFGDLFNKSALEELVARSDVIVHLAARNPRTEAEDRTDRVSFFGTNSLGAANIARLSRKYERRLVYSSSVAVYELSARVEGIFAEDEELPGRSETQRWIRLAEATIGRISTAWLEEEIHDPSEELVRFFKSSPPPDNEGIYALSKFLGEPWITPLQEGIVLRLSDVYGPGHESRGLIREYLQAMLCNDEVTIDFGPRELVSFVYMHDVLRALLRAATASLADAPKITNVALPSPVREDVLEDYLGQIIAEAGLSSPISIHRTLPPENSRSFATDNMKSYLGIQRPLSLLEGLRETLRYLQLPVEQRQQYVFAETE